MDNKNTYKAKLVLVNETAFNNFLKSLTDQNSLDNIPIEKLVDFEFKWGFIPTI